MSNFKSRLFAYFIDIFLVALIVSFLSSFLVRTDNYNKLNNELNDITEKYINGDISTSVYINNQAEISHDIAKENFFVNLLQGFIIVGYFIILPYCNNGQTLGKKLLKIKIISENDNLEYNQLIIRSLIVNELGYLLITMSLVYILPSFGYFILTSILSFIEFIIFIVNIILIIKNNDHKGLHDILCKTKVIEI